MNLSSDTPAPKEGPESKAGKEAGSGRLSSVTSALLVMKAFSAEEAEIGISSLAKRMGLAKSTVHRLAVTLAAEGFLEQNPETGRYRLGLSLFTLGALARRRMDVSNVSRPLLGVLRDKYQEAATLAILSGTSIMYLHNLESGQAIGIRAHIGDLKPAFCTAEGRVLLAYSPASLVSEVLTGDMTARTPRTVSDPAELQRGLEEVRVSGYAIDDEESEAGMRCVAAPVRDISGKVVAAVGLAGPTQRLTKKDLRTMAPEVVATGEAVSVRLGWRAR
jgi:IclR family transcriptional regulator, KDG regulon repressor